MSPLSSLVTALN